MVKPCLEGESVIIFDQCCLAEQQTNCAEKKQWPYIKAIHNLSKLMPGNCVRPFMVGFFPLKYNLAHCYSDDGGRNTTGEVFSCVFENCALSTACLWDMTAICKSCFLNLCVIESKLASSASRCYSLLWLCLFDPCGLKQRNTKEVSRADHNLHPQFSGIYHKFSFFHLSLSLPSLWRFWQFPHITARLLCLRPRQKETRRTPSTCICLH